MIYVTTNQMKELDRRAIEEFGIPASRLMENAGRTVADEAMKIAKKGRAIVFCGYGNNGGDGLVAARYLIKNGRDARVFLVGKPRSLSPETNANLELLLELNLRPEFIVTKEEMASVFSNLEKPTFIIDAIFGIGIRGALDDFYLELIDRINRLGSSIIAVDIPSGLDADTGFAFGNAIKARTTVTLGYPKIGFKNPEARNYIGNLVIADIGLPTRRVPLQQTKEATCEKVVKLRRGRQGKIRPGHPWIYKGQFLKPDPSIKAGDIVTIKTCENKFVGIGYYNPASEISIRILSFSDETIDKNFFDDKIRRAIKKRERLFKLTNAYRAIFSEGDGLPGLIVDVYSETVVFQVLTLGMERFKAVFVESIKDILNPKYIYEKSDSPFRKREGLKEAKKWWGGKGDARIEIFEGKARFLVDIENGHKTGFYLDQRKSRLAMENISQGKKVLDLFSYTGSFSISAAINGATEVRGVDIKEDWLRLARRNAELNGVSERIEFVRQDAFTALRNIHNSSETFDIIIIDPPSFLKKRESLKSASKGYKELNLLAMKSLNEGGILATFSCSHNMPNERFSEILKEAAGAANKKITILKRCRQAEDHSIVRLIPQTSYLKGYFLKVDTNLTS